MGKITVSVKLSEEQLKQTAMHALEYSINGLLLQFQLKYNVRITGIQLAENNNLRGVQIGWEETASGIRTDKQVQQLISQQASKQLAKITEKLANNG